MCVIESFIFNIFVRSRQSIRFPSFRADISDTTSTTHGFSADTNINVTKNQIYAQEYRLNHSKLQENQNVSEKKKMLGTLTEPAPSLTLPPPPPSLSSMNRITLPWEKNLNISTQIVYSLKELRNFSKQIEIFEPNQRILDLYGKILDIRNKNAANHTNNSKLVMNPKKEEKKIEILSKKKEEDLTLEEKRKLFEQEHEKYLQSRKKSNHELKIDNNDDPNNLFSDENDILLASKVSDSHSQLRRDNRDSTLNFHDEFDMSTFIIDEESSLDNNDKKSSRILQFLQEKEQENENIDSKYSSLFDLSVNLDSYPSLLIDKHVPIIHTSSSDDVLSKLGLKSPSNTNDLQTSLKVSEDLLSSSSMKDGGLSSPPLMTGQPNNPSSNSNTHVRKGPAMSAASKLLLMQMQKKSSTNNNITYTKIDVNTLFHK